MKRKDLHQNAGNTSVYMKSARNVYFVKEEMTAISCIASQCWKLIGASLALELEDFELLLKQNTI